MEGHSPSFWLTCGRCEERTLDCLAVGKAVSDWIRDIASHHDRWRGGSLAYR